MYWLLHKWLTTAVDQPTDQPSQYTDQLNSLFSTLTQVGQYTKLFIGLVNSSNQNSVECQRMNGIVKFGPSIINPFWFINQQTFDADTKFVICTYTFFSIYNQWITFSKLNYISLHYNEKDNFWTKFLDSGDSEWPMT